MRKGLNMCILKFVCNCCFDLTNQLRPVKDAYKSGEAP